ncbi:MAG: outer membrane protein transport protein [Alcanivorax sp.]|uniref:Outer membrane protein transport protein n=1 Tax=Alloalcanivorax marinus TaxID=1177169 RepID=A0A9Q3YT58_9GAMM|nr:outer membrane protein transport protein [Alloalcanivorax marinus]MBM7335232.1 outer membrane protein transport protein [Alloalcanivorax marinus]MCC4310278.1 outer membrane protein transport protein [Alloalcanivorax marinus]MCU5787347.1 membrane protein involved in aromatic hydrocarbon degradation [Alloalcanivorax marinus]
MKNNKIARGLALALVMGTGSTAFASMGNIGTTYGVLPTDVASAQALSMFNTKVSSVYYNPAYLAKDPRGELTVGLLHAEHELRVNSLGGPAAPIRRGDVLQDSPSQHTLIGLKSNLSNLTRFNHPLYLGVMIGIEKYGEEMLAFESETSRTGQYFEYGRQPLFLSLGGATQLWRGIDVGASARITLQSEAELSAYTNLAGETRYEKLDVSAKPEIRPTLSVTMDLGETFCPDGNCWLDGFETAFAFRGYSNTNTTVDANTVIPGVIDEPGLSLAVTTLDSYQPNIYSAGLLYRTDRLRLGASLELQQWSDLEDEFDGDTIKDQAVSNDDGVGILEFQDVVIPRIGAEYQLNQNFAVTGGVAYSESPLKSNASLNVNYLDTDKWIFGLGLTAKYERTRFFSFPVRFDIAYQYQKLDPRTFDLYDTRSPSYPQPYETVEADGDVNVITGAVTLKF